LWKKKTKMGNYTPKKYSDFAFIQFKTEKYAKECFDRREDIFIGALQASVSYARPPTTKPNSTTIAPTFSNSNPSGRR